MKVKRVLIISIAAIIAFVSLAVSFAALMNSGVIGCWVAPESSLDEEALREEFDNLKTDVSATLNVAIMNEGSEIEIMQEAKEGFKQLYPNVNVEIKPVTDYDKQVLVDMGSGSKYDVIWVSDQYVDTYAGTYVEDLDLFMEITEFDTSLYYESAIKLGQKNHDGAQIFMPRDYNKLVVYLNKQVFDEYGVDLPTLNDWTWEDFLETCKELYDNGCKARNDCYPVGLQYDWRILMASISKSFGGTIVNPDGTIELDENSQKAIKELKTLIDSGYSIYRNSTQVINDFLAGHFAMCVQVRPYAKTFMTPLGSNLQVVAFPEIQNKGGDAGYCGTGTTGYAITKISENKALAWRFIEYLMSESGQEKISKSGAIVPSLKSLATKSDAEWRSGKYAGLNNDAFIHSGTKDAIYDFYDMLPNSIYVNFYDGNIGSLLTQYYQEGKDLLTLVEKCREDINGAIAKNGNLVPVKV